MPDATDALARLRNRQRPTVPNRDASLTSRSADISTSRHLDSEIPDSQPPAVAAPATAKPDTAKPDAQASPPSDPPTAAPPDLQKSRYPDIEISTPPDIEALKTKQSTLRLEAGLSDRLQQFCRQEGICREVLIEALFEHFEHHADTHPQVLAIAHTKNEHRQTLANLKRAQSMMKRFSQGT
ncbi:MAG: hypothetical protein O3A14_03565 [Cyanobacteria bacterium]|nr:hypothetical protein [Cyanobacteriota bacterium]